MSHDGPRRRHVLSALAGVGTAVTGCVGSDGDGADGENGTVGDEPGGGATGGGNGTDDAAGTSSASSAASQVRAHRATTLVVSVLDAAGNPVPDAAVDVNMRRHAFGFGTAVDAGHLVETGRDDDYRRYLSQLFNRAVLENGHKWAFWEDDAARERATRATDWLLSRGLEMRGHAGVWQRPNQGAIPDDVVEAVAAGDAGHVSRRATDHLRSITGHYADVPGVTEWDVLNEQLDYHAMTNVIDPFADSLAAPALGDWFEAAGEGDPDARLYVNEFGVLTGDDQCRRREYERLVRHLHEADVGLGGVGLQAHHVGYDSARTAEELRRDFDRFADVGLPLQVTEYDTWGDGWTEEREADYLETFFRAAFGHPAVTGILLWGFWDGAHWQDNAPLFREDWSAKPAFDVYRGLVYDEWWTEESGRTGDGGTYETSAFLGEYEITASAGDRSATVTASLSNPGSPTRVEIRLSDG